MSGQPETTIRQRRILEAFRERAASGAPPPTHRELCRQFGWKSTATARDHIRALVRKGILLPADRRSRGAHLLGQQVEGKLLPLVGRIVAGQPLMSDEQVEKKIFVPAEFVPRGNAFMLRVMGDSMEGIGVFANDLVIVRRTRAAQLGDVVAVTIDGESTLKILAQRADKWLLVAANRRYTPIEIDSPATIHGVVTAVMRSIENGSARIFSWARLAGARGD